MGKIQIDTEHIRKMTDDYSYVMCPFAGAYAAQKRGAKIRPRLGGHIPFNYMRGRQTLTFLFYPELKETAYEIPRIVGGSIILDQIRGKTSPEIMESNQPTAQRDGHTSEEVVEADETHVVHRHHECTDCYDLPNIYSEVCAYEAGTATGMFSAALGKPCQVTEAKHCANDDPCCEFLVEVL